MSLPDSLTRSVLPPPAPAPAPAQVPDTAASVTPVPSSSPEVRENSDAKKSKAIVELKNEWVQVINTRKALIEDTKNLIEEMQQLIDEIKSHLSDNASSQFARQIDDIGDALGEVSKTTNQQIAKLSDLLSAVQRLQINDPDNENLTKLVVKLKEGITKLANSQNLPSQHISQQQQSQTQQPVQGQQQVQGQHNTQGPHQVLNSQDIKKLAEKTINSEQLKYLNKEDVFDLNTLNINYFDLDDTSLDNNIIALLSSSLKNSSVLKNKFFDNDTKNTLFQNGLNSYNKFKHNNSLNKNEIIECNENVKNDLNQYFAVISKNFLEREKMDLDKIPFMLKAMLTEIDLSFIEKLKDLINSMNNKNLSSDEKNKLSENLKERRSLVLLRFFQHIFLKLIVDEFKLKNIAVDENLVKDYLVHYFKQRNDQFIEDKSVTLNSLELIINEIIIDNYDKFNKLFEF